MILCNIVCPCLCNATLVRLIVFMQMFLLILRLASVCMYCCVRVCCDVFMVSFAAVVVMLLRLWRVRASVCVVRAYECNVLVCAMFAVAVFAGCYIKVIWCEPLCILLRNTHCPWQSVQQSCQRHQKVLLNNQVRDGARDTTMTSCRDNLMNSILYAIPECITLVPLPQKIDDWATYTSEASPVDPLKQCFHGFVLLRLSLVFLLGPARSSHCTSSPCPVPPPPWAMVACIYWSLSLSLPLSPHMNILQWTGLGLDWTIQKHLLQYHYAGEVAAKYK